jgi:hypothetical protein
MATPTGTWATVAMGHLDDPVNTFWQLVFLADTTPVWHLATPPGVASNGGLVASVDASGAVAVGFEPSVELRFSPLARSTDRAATWVPGVLPGGLASVPDALAASNGHGYLALLGGGQVEASAGDLTSWTTVATTRGLTADPATAGCGVEALSAAGFGTGGEDLVGAACAHGTRPGLFARVGGSWRSVAPALPVVSGPSQVVRLVDTPAGVTALVTTGTGPTRRLFALWSADDLHSWSVSAPEPLGRARLISTGVSVAGGLVVAATSAAGARSASTITPTGSQWQGLASPPLGTSAVVATPGGGYDALVPDRSTLDVDALSGGGWRPIQALTVPIQYGSSG